MQFEQICILTLNAIARFDFEYLVQLVQCIFILKVHTWSGVIKDEYFEKKEVINQALSIRLDIFFKK